MGVYIIHQILIQHILVFSFLLEKSIMDGVSFPWKFHPPLSTSFMSLSPSDSNILVSFVLLMKSHLQSYPCPLQINFFWNLGFLLQIITGIFLGLHYTSDLNSAYSSVFFFIREIYYGWCFISLEVSSTIKHFFHEFITFKYRIHGLWIINVRYILMSHIY